MRSRSAQIRAAARRGACLASLLGLTAAHAGTQSFQGQFSSDDQLFVTTFVLPADELFSASTLGYGGGLDAAGLNRVGGGGFAPVLALFEDSLGLVQVARGSSNVCGPGAGNADPVSGFCWDAGLSLTLPAGSYTLVLSQDGNEPQGQSLAQGYTQTGQPDYTGLAYLGQPGAMFIQVDGMARSGAWALDLQAASVPEPGTRLALLLGMAAIALRRIAARTPT